MALPFLLSVVSTPTSVFAAPPGRKPEHVPPTKMPPLPPALIDENLEIGGENIGGRKVSTRMTVEVQVNGRGPFRFVVDSGADSSVVGYRIARALDLPAGTPVVLNGMTASSRVDRVLVDELGLGPTTIRNLELPVLQERDFGGEGMIGIDALVQQRLMLDFEKRVIKVEDARRPAQRLDGEIVVTARRRRGQLILTQARANGKQVSAVIDTGSELTIGNLALRDQLLRRYRDKFTTVAVTGVTGVTVDLQMAHVAELRLGPVIMQNVPIAFAEVPPFAVFGLSDQPALLLGTDLMETFRRVSLDFRARKVRFQLRRCRARGFMVKTSTLAPTSRLALAENSESACRR
jgi:predicted aspartyl protease